MTEDGTIVWRGKQQLWGREEGINKDDAPTCRLRFPGQYEDAESGLYYNRFRYYDCETGQYISADPIGLLGGLNSYGYVSNSLKWIDPLGLFKEPDINSSPLDVFNYALQRQGLSESNYPINFKEKFTIGNYKYEVRAHDVNPNAPPGSNSANGPIYRVSRSQSGINPATNQGHGWEYGSPDGVWHHTSILKPNSPSYNPGAANDTHIPLPIGVIP